MSIDKILATIESIYDAGMDEACWPLAMERLADLLQAMGATIAFQDATGRIPVYHYARSTPQAQQAYAEHYSKIDPVLALTSRMPQTVLTDRMILSTAELHRSEIYNDYARPNNMRSSIQAVTLSTPDCSGLVAAARSHSQCEFDDEHVRISETLLPHLTRAMRLHLRLRSADIHTGSTTAALNRIASGVIFVDRRLRILFANTEAETMLAQSDGIGIHSSILCAASTFQTSALRELVARTADRTHAVGRGGLLRLARPSMRRPLLVQVLPIGTGGASRWIPEPRPAAIIFVFDPERTYRHQAPYLSELYGLTPAEAAVAEAIARGQGVPETARKLHVAPSTVRWHLQRVFDKTGTARQAELACLVQHLGITNCEEAGES
ncbi:MAG: helix-turn-helix transcriptional regulator [Acetobacteraceae bacterium]